MPRGKYIPITEEQQARANAVDLVELLRSQGELLKRSGSEYLWTRHKGVTVKGNEWYSNYDVRGGWAIDFMRFFYNLSYPEAVFSLLGENMPRIDDNSTKDGKQEKKQDAEKKPFALPEAHSDMRRVYAYLLQIRFIDREVVSHFAHARLLYEEKQHHDAIFVGVDEHGVPRHAHKKGTWSDVSFQADVTGSDFRYCFHHVGQSDTLHVFEAPVDMLSYITLRPQNWQRDSYVTLDGVTEHALLWILEQYPHLTKVILRADNDPGGIEADYRLSEILREHGREDIEIDKSVYKDWNEDLKSLHGAIPIPAQPHPKLVILPLHLNALAADCGGMNPRKVRWEHIQAEQSRLMVLTKQGSLYLRPEIELLPHPLRQNAEYLTAAGERRATELLRGIGVRAILRIADERRQLERPVDAGRIVEALGEYYAPHKDHGRFRSKVEQVHRDCLAIHRLIGTPGQRTLKERGNMLSAYFRLAQDCLCGELCLTLSEQAQTQVQESQSAMKMN